MKKAPVAKGQHPLVFTPALEAVRGDLLKYLDTFCYLVVSHDWYWGRGDTVEEAAQACVNQGASRKAHATLLLILGDATAEINEGGNIIRDAGSHRITIIERIRLGPLVSKSDPGKSCRRQ